MGFMYAPRYHPAMKAVVPVRRSLKVRKLHGACVPLPLRGAAFLPRP